MKITICGSMTFAKKMLETSRRLQSIGLVCYLPEGVEHYITGKIQERGGPEGAQRKIEHDLIKKHYQVIKNSDAILVLNYTKKGIENYIGGNSFLEMGFAYILNKPIFLLNPIPSVLFAEEVMTMKPTIINGDLAKISNQQ